ncbi:MAG TPA: hypothetical protein VGM65_06905 [Candidatus Udaeobacter sp.]
MRKIRAAVAQKRCCGDIVVEHQTIDLVDVRIGALRSFPFKPKVHLNYEETILPDEGRIT